jgi:hypothetical protein
MIEYIPIICAAVVTLVSLLCVTFLIYKGKL